MTGNKEKEEVTFLLSVYKPCIYRRQEDDLSRETLNSFELLEVSRGSRV